MSQTLLLRHRCSLQQLQVPLVSWKSWNWKGYSSDKPAANTSPSASSKNTAKVRPTSVNPAGKLDEHEEGKHPYQEKDPLQPFPNNTNPNTGEIGGPRGPEPTRFGDWERKGRVSDF